jgi:GNAT superfamily N-acetyltransferase
MTPTADNDLYIRGAATLLASWEEYARGSAGASLKRLDGVSAAVFPSDPERALYNNALLDRDLGATERAAAVDAMVAAYSAARRRPLHGVGPRERRGNARRAERPRVRRARIHPGRWATMSLDGISLAPPEVGLGPLDWPEYSKYLRLAGLPAGLLSGADPSAFHVLAARLAGETVATAIAFDHDGDCGVFNMSTLEAARRRGLGTALTARHLQDAVERRCSTASLQSTAMAERVYAAVGFRDLGRILEYARATQGVSGRLPADAPTGASRP